MDNILYTNGCSWTAGDGITSDPAFVKTSNTRTDLHTSRKLTWSSVLGAKLGYTVLNDAIGGGSNKRVIRTTCNFLMNYPKDRYKDLTVVIGWTTVDRDEIFLEDTIRGNWYRFNAHQQFSTSITGTIHPLQLGDIDKYQKAYITHIYNQGANMELYIQQKYLLSNLLNSLGVKYLFFDSLPGEFVDNGLINYNAELEKIKTPNMITDITFNSFCLDNKISISKCIHPMIDGHRLWGEYLYEKIHSLYGDAL